ncbi:MAG: FliH/SctL family protein, partial [Pseudomonadota bacterium]
DLRADGFMKILKNRKILKKEFLRALEKGDEVVAEADRIAERIVGGARQEADRIRADARSEGFELGKAQAVEIICRAEEEKRAARREVEKETIDLALETASSILRKQIELEPETVAGLYRAALAALESEGAILLRVSPSNLDAARSFLNIEREGEGVLKRVEVVGDETIGAGGCIVESDAGIVDGRLETQLLAIRKAFMDNLDAPDGGGR